jgi:hypothetical protein
MNKSVKSSPWLKLRNALKKIGIEKFGYTAAAAAQQDINKSNLTNCLFRESIVNTVKAGIWLITLKLYTVARQLVIQTRFPIHLQLSRTYTG